MNAICVVRGFCSKEVTSLLVCGNITAPGLNFTIIYIIALRSPFSLFFVGMLLSQAGRRV